MSRFQGVEGKYKGVEVSRCQGVEGKYKGVEVSRCQGVEGKNKGAEGKNKKYKAPACSTFRLKRFWSAQITGENTESRVKVQVL